MHVTVTSGPYFAGDLIVFSTGVLITALLLILTLRAAKLPGTPFANIMFACCALLWSAGGLAQVALVSSGLTPRHPWVLAAQAVQYLGAAAFPIPILTIWRPFARSQWQKTAIRTLQICAWISAAVLASRWAMADGSDRPLQLWTAANASLLLLLGAFATLRRNSTPRAIYVPSLAIVLAVFGAMAAMGIGYHGLGRHGTAFVGAHLILMVVLCSFLLFARFRYADVFIRYGVRILLAGTWAALLTVSVQGTLLWSVIRHSSSPGVVHVLAVMLIANALLLSFTFFDERLSLLINRWMFRAPDYRGRGRQLADQLRGLQAGSEIAAAVEDAARGALQLGDARLTAVEKSAAWPPAIFEGEVVEVKLEVLIPVVSGGRVSHVLIVSPGPARPGLVSSDLDFLRTVAVQCGNRLDALERERETAERRSREALLLQQVTEAELRALRAQINPHFLFNSLNTIADLIVRDPQGAEAMTLRLASVFRHVLAHSARSLTSVRDEIEFLRTYLHIEEARFGDRLQVVIDVAPEIAAEQIPSLILQPLVENAVRHGLGPKPQQGHLWIRARAVGDHLHILIEDDGVGPGSRASDGVGLSNVADRLRTLYDDRGSVTLEPREGGGSRVTVVIPRSSVLDTV